MSDDAIVSIVLSMHPKTKDINNEMEFYVRKTIELTRKQMLVDMGVLINNKIDRWR